MNEAEAVEMGYEHHMIGESVAACFGSNGSVPTHNKLSQYICTDLYNEIIIIIIKTSSTHPSW